MKSLKELNLYSQLNKKDKDKIDKIYSLAIENFYSRANWPEWVDHSIKHIDNVLHYLDKLIPEWVLPCIKNKEAFLLLASAILHDIGMFPNDLPPKDDPDHLKLLKDRYNEIRKNHGFYGSIHCVDFFKNLIDDDDMLIRICDIVKNHCTDFKPMNLTNNDYPHYGADAFLVRMADGIDFGEKRAPSWLFDVINPSGEQEKYWVEHQNIGSPDIDNKFLRINIKCKVRNDDFIISLKNDFNSNRHHQNDFFKRGFKKDLPCHYIIVDEIDESSKPGLDNLKKSRPTFFSKENYLIAARYLYNLAQYEAAKNAFNDGVTKFSNSWSVSPCKYYYYHFLQTYNKLGKYSETISLIDSISFNNFSNNEKAAIYIAKGIAHFKLHDHHESIMCFKDARSFYNLSRDKNLINIADTWVWESIIEIEELREKKNKLERVDTGRMNDYIKMAEHYYLKYEENQPENTETHYKGRYFGLLAFCKLFDIDNKKETNSQLIEDTIKLAIKAYGGEKSEARVPFGILSGKYAEAAVYLFKYLKFKNKKIDLIQSSESLVEVFKSYKNIYGGNRIPYTFDKIKSLAREILELDENISTDLSKYCKEFDINKNDKKNVVEIFTPLN